MSVVRGQELKEDARLFVYGTLCFPNVIESLLGYVPGRVPCKAYGCQRYKVRERVYPMLRAEADGIVADTAYVYENLAVSDWKILDAFEDPRYELRTVSTSLGSALAYMSCDESMESDGPWISSRFQTEHLADYIAMCRRWRASMP